MKYFLIILLFLVACDATHRGDLKTEKGLVVEKQFAPEINTSAMGWNFGKGGGITVTDVHVPDKYLVFFKCEHQVIFYQENKKLWETLNRGDSVYINYYDVLDNNNKVVDLIFSDAYKIHP